ncbi:MAG: hypothetical protein A2Y14_05585 [Verrucomicrobia bacterium GWF2_51_19]|nr:MAG: hypothetical protein A2Y14_05585 [Verrucomicrobia bacterium GWF2_51_19]HCJ12122.1 beta-hydroxyacyl-ACP dehydratase [Opitutae bacterium]
MSLDIKAYIPHREPFLFVDRVLEMTETTILTEKTWRADEDFFRGHYPENPILPGVLMCESVFQTAAILLVERLKAQGDGLSGKTPILSRIQDSRFKRRVLPGETVTMSVELKETVGQFFFLSGRIEKDKKTVLTVDFALALVNNE